MKKTLLVLSLSLGLSQVALAEEASKAPATAKPAVETSAGEALFKAKTCWSCHGKDAKTPILPIYPKIAGQNEAYIVNQMMDIKTGKRANGQAAAMKGVMGLVSEDEIKKIAKWLATQ